MHEEFILERIKYLPYQRTQETGAKVEKREARAPYVSGTIWADNVASYMMELYPELFEAGMTFDDLYPLLLGRNDEDSWY